MNLIGRENLRNLILISLSLSLAFALRRVHFN